MTAGTGSPRVDGAEATRQRRRAVVGGAFAITIALVAWPLLTYVGIPEGHYPSAPDPCQLVSERTVQAVTAQAGPPRTRDSDNLPGGSALGLAHKARHRTCEYSGPGHFDGPVDTSYVHVRVSWYTSTQFDLGPSGTERAERHFNVSLDAYGVNRDECAPERREADGNVCGFQRISFGATVLIQRENVYVSVAISSLPGSPFELPDGWQEQRIAEIAEEVLAALESAP